MPKAKACLVCGEELEYFNESRLMTCEYCHGTFSSNAACRSGHFVCDRCHAKQAVAHILAICRETPSTDPQQIALTMMRDPFVHMHGPEHHVLVGAALLAAYHNAGGAVDLAAALAEIQKRGAQVPGGACGFWGCCGAAVGAGVFMSVVTGATPLSTDAFGLCNQATSMCLAVIGEVGGPRCCKRNSLLAIRQAAALCRDVLHVPVTLRDAPVCTFQAQNAQCIGGRCPFSAKRT